MCRFALTSIGLAIVLPLSAAPVPEAEPAAPRLYFPTTVGAKWEYDSGSYPVHKVAAVEKKGVGKDQVWIVRVAEFDAKGREGSAKSWEVSARGLFLIQNRGEKDEIRACYLKLPHKEGDKWQIPLGRFDFSRWVSLKAQRVKVAAGDFEAVGVEVYVADRLFVTRWYAPEVGLVKIGDDKNTSLELKSFTPGKD